MSEIWVSIRGDGIYETLPMAAIPRKGDILWLDSLTRNKIPEVLVSKVEWCKDQVSGRLHVWLTVRRINRKVRE